MLRPAASPSLSLWLPNFEIQLLAAVVKKVTRQHEVTSDSPKHFSRTKDALERDQDQQSERRPTPSDSETGHRLADLDGHRGPMHQGLQLLPACDHLPVLSAAKTKALQLSLSVGQQVPER